MDKKAILDNVQNLTAEQLFKEINYENVTLTELVDTEQLDSFKRKLIISLLKKQESEDDLVWERARNGNELSLHDYISCGYKRHKEEALMKIKDFEDHRQKAIHEKNKILNQLKRNYNSYTPGIINKYLKDGIISEPDLLDCNIPQSIIDKLNNIVQPRLHLGDTPASIPDGFTEVYFWGIPGSGKTCALAATLSTAEKLGYLDIATGPGYDYMTRLKNIFARDSAVLPPPSPVETTQYLPFILKKGNDKARSVSLIELSGEIFQCFYRKNANLPMLTQHHENTFESLIRFLKGSNRKIHFFFIDFEKENDPDADGYKQGDYLSAASTFFRNNDIFGKATDAIYVVITKSDLMPDKNTYDERVAHSKQYLSSNNFSAFINSLKDRCNQHSINAGKLTVEPFSLGKVFFQQICDFDKSSAENIINILIDRIPPNKKSILDFFNK